MSASGLAPSDQHLARVALGITIKNLRQRKGISQALLGAKIYLSQPEVSKLERATEDAKSIDEKLLEQIAKALGATEAEQATLNLQFELMRLPIDSYRVIFATSAVQKQRKILAYEALTTTVTQFEHAIMPGLLQVPDYMRAVIKAYGVPNDQIEEVVVERHNRQRVLSNSNRRFHFLLAEAVLYTCPANVEVQVEQLRTLLAHTARRNVRVGIIRTVDGIDPLAATAFTIYDDSFAVVETIISEQEITDETDLRTLLRLHKKLEGRANYGDDADRLIRAAIASLEGRPTYALQS